MKMNEREERRKDMCRQFRASKMTRKAFCENNGIGLSTLGFWLRKERKAEENKSVKQMVSVGTVAAQEIRRTLRIRMKAGIVLELDLPASEGDIQSVIRAVVGF